MGMVAKGCGEANSIIIGAVIGGLITLIVAWIYFRRQRRASIAAILFEADAFSLGLLANKICHLLRYSNYLTGQDRINHILGSFAHEAEIRILTENVTRIQAQILSLRAQFFLERRIDEVERFAEQYFYWGFWSPFYQV